MSKDPGNQNKRSMLKPLWALLCTGAVGYASVATLVWWEQEALLFHPEKLSQDHAFKHTQDVKEAWVSVTGARLNALHLQLPNPRGVVFFLHGNAGSLQSWFSDVDRYRQLNLDLFMVDYRGFGKSTGRIESEEQLLSDARAAWASVADRYTGKQIFFMGRSLGTGLAATLAVEVQPVTTVLVAPYLSMQDMASRYYPWLPSSILRYPLRTDEAIQKIKSSVVLIHGDRDDVVPPDSSARLAAITPKAKRILIAGAGHNDLDAFAAYGESLSNALEQPVLPK